MVGGQSDGTFVTGKPNSGNHWVGAVCGKNGETVGGQNQGCE
jgi:hypothetical protein